jgi:predicted O-methyltransferase YrrM
MDEGRWPARAGEVERYLIAALVPTDPALDAAREARARAGLPAHEVSPTEGKLLYLLARTQGARRILEIGTFAGYSTLWLARALPPDGRLVSLEADPAHAALARANIARAGLDGVVDVRVGPALETLPHLTRAGLGPFDLIFIDADKRNNPQYLEWSLALSRPGTLIIADNVIRSGAVADPSHADPDVQGVRRFYEMLAADRRVTATAIQTVGAKGWDGLAFILVVAGTQRSPRSAAEHA